MKRISKPLRIRRSRVSSKLPKFFTLEDVRKEADGSVLVALEEGKYLFSNAILINPIDDSVIINNLPSGVTSTSSTENRSITLFYGGIDMTAGDPIGTYAYHLSFFEGGFLLNSENTGAGIAVYDGGSLEVPDGVYLGNTIAVASAIVIPENDNSWGEVQFNADFTFRESEGTKIGTAVTQKLSFWNATPVTQQYGDVLKTLTTLGLNNDSRLNYGSMYMNAGSQSVTVSSSSTYYSVGGGLSGGLSNGFSFQNSKELKCLDAGTYLFKWSMTVSCATPLQELAGGIMVGSTIDSTTLSVSYLPTANKKINISGTGIITLALNDLILLAVANLTASQNIVVSYANLTACKVEVPVT